MFFLFIHDTGGERATGDGSSIEREDHKRPWPNHWDAKTDNWVDEWIWYPTLYIIQINKNTTTTLYLSFFIN
jgi:hypothetical protein